MVVPPLDTAKPCNSKKRGEYNWLRCCLDKGHSGDHNYVIDRTSDLTLDELEARQERFIP
jgi:hypothetical protein